MVRVVLTLLTACLIAGCSINSRQISAGLSPSETPTGSVTPRTSRGLGGDPASRTAQPPAKSGDVVALNDRAPKGSFERAPAGALSGRDYTTVRLDAERARDLINVYRREKGLKPLKLSPELTEAAKVHARDLAKWDRISHYGSDGSNPWDRVKRTGYQAKLAAENVGTGQVTLEEVFKGWQDSPGHNKNLLLADAVDMGIALVYEPKSEFKTFWTLVIGSAL